MDVRGSNAAGWSLVLGGFLLLAVMGRVGLALLLLPVAAVVAYGVTRLPGTHTMVRPGLK